MKTANFQFCKALKSLIAAIFCVATFSSGQAQGTQYPIVLVPQNLYSDMSNVNIQNNVFEVATDMTLTKIDSHTIALTNTSFFQYLGVVVFDTTDSVNSTMYGYRYIYTGYPAPASGDILFIDLSLNYMGAQVNDFSSSFKPCDAVNTCPSRILMLNSMDLFYSLPFPGYSDVYTSLQSYNQQVEATVFNWILNNPSPTVSDYLDIMGSPEGQATQVPSVFCTGGSITTTCAQQRQLFDTIQNILTSLIAIGPDSFSAFNDINTRAQTSFMFHCYMGGSYFPTLSSNDDGTGYILRAFSPKGGPPIISSLVQFDGDSIYTRTAYSYTNVESGLGLVYTGHGKFSCQTGYFLADTGDSTFTAFPTSRPTIRSSGSVVFCNDDSVVLISSDTIHPRHWSTADTSRRITAKIEGNYSLNITGSGGCLIKADTTISVQMTISDLNIACEKCADEGGNIAHFWNLNYNYNLDATAYLYVTSKHSTIIGLSDTRLVKGVNHALITVTTPSSNLFSADTLTVFLIDSASGDSCRQTIYASLQCPYTEYFQPCASSPIQLSNPHVSCLGKDSILGMPNYLVTLTVSNNSSSDIFSGVIASFGAQSWNEKNAGLLAPGSRVDSIYLQPDSANRNQICLSFGTTDNLLCPSCIQQICVDLPVPAPPVFLSGLTLLCKGDSACYIAQSANSSIVYSIASGNVLVDSISGCVRNALSDFVLRATAHYACNSASTDLNVSVVPHTSISPLDTAVWAGDSVILVASGGIAYSWPALSVNTTAVHVAPTSNSTFIVIVTDPNGCFDSALATIEAVDTLLLTVTTAHDTIYPFDSTYIFAKANLPNTVITWHRDNAANISGDTSGTGATLKELIINNASTRQTVHFEFQASNAGHVTQTTQNLYYGARSSASIYANTNDGEFVSACNQVLVDTIIIFNGAGLNNGAGFTIKDTLPLGANIINHSSCAGVTFSNASNIVTWTIPNSVSDTCTLIVAMNFDCSLATRQNIIAIGTIPAGTINNITNRTITYNIDQPAILVTAPTSPTYALIGDTVVRTWKICGDGGRIDSLTLTYSPEDEINSPLHVISLTISDSSVHLSPTHLASGSSSYTVPISPASFDTLFGQPFMAFGQCIKVTDLAVATACSRLSPRLTTLDPVFHCAIGSTVCPNTNVPQTADVIVRDDYDNVNGIDLSPLKISKFQLLQGTSDVTSLGTKPCDTTAVSFIYSIANPVRSDTTHLVHNANFKSLNTFTTQIDRCWLSTTNMVVQLCDSNGANCVTLSSPLEYSLSGNTLNISFTQLGSSCSAFLNTHLPFSGSTFNELNENSGFKIKISGLKVQQCSQMSSCSQFANTYILGQSSGSIITYYTMCDHYNSVNLFLGDYLNYLNSAFYGASIPPDVSGTQAISALNFCLEQYAGSSNPWRFYDERVHPFFNCPSPSYQVELFIPINFTLDTGTAFLPTGGHRLPINSITFVGQQVFAGDTCNVYNLIDTALGNSGCIEAKVIFNGHGCHGLGGFSTTHARVYALCDSSCHNDLYCMGTLDNLLHFSCGGGCGATGIGIDSLRPMTTLRKPIASEYSGSGPIDLDRAYPCDEVEVIVKAHAFKDTAFHAGAYYLMLTYDSIPGVANSLFSVASADYSKDSISWSSIDTFNNPIVNAGGQWQIKAFLPGGCSSGTVSHDYMDSSQTFYVKVTLKVNYDLPWGYNNGIYELQDIRADMRLKDCSGNDHGSCDTHGGHLLLLAHHYIETERYLAPDEQGYPFTDICTQRLLIQTSAEGGLPQSAEMPNEVRPLIIWPNDSTAANTLTVSGLSGTMPIDSGLQQFQYPSNISAFTSLCTTCNPQTSDSVKFLGLTGSGWPIFGKVGGYSMALLGQFAKTTCADDSISTRIKFNYWTRGMDSMCSSAANYFASGTHRPIVQRTPNRTTDHVALLTTNGSGYTRICDIFAQDTIFTFNSELQYSGSQTGAPSTWIYPILPPQIDSIRILSGSGLGNRLYDTSGALYLPGGTTNLQFEAFLNPRASGCHPGIYPITFITGYTCNQVFNGTEPTLSNLNTCGIDTSIVIVHVVGPIINLNCPNCAPALSGDWCKSYPFSFKMEADGSPIYAPGGTILVPLGAELQSVKILFSCGNVLDSTLVLGINLNGDTAYTYYDCSAIMQALLASHSLNNLAIGCSFSITATFTGSSNLSDGRGAIYFTGTGHNMCGDTLTAVSTAAAITFQQLKVELKPNTCGNDTSGTVTVKVTSVNPNFTYHWSGAGMPSNSTTSQSTLTETITVTGIYSVSVTDSAGCSASSSDTVTRFDPPIRDSIIVVNVTCHNQSNGSISVITTGGLAPYTYVWAGPNSYASDSSHIFNLAGGLYHLTVTDSANCRATPTVTVINPNAIAISMTVTDATCGAANGTIIGKATGGTGTLTYSWTPSSLTDTINNLSVGTSDTLIVTDGHSCSDTAIAVVGQGTSAYCCIGDPDSLNPGQTLTYYGASTSPYDLTNISQSLPAGTTIALNGVFELAPTSDTSSNVVFYKYKILMGNNSKIIIHYGQTLLLEGSLIESCNLMWDGIYIEAGGTLRTQSVDQTQQNVMNDAMGGIVLHDSANAFITSTYFYRNYRSIYFDHYYNGNYGIAASTFDFKYPAESGVGMKPDSNGHTPYNRPLVGIYAQSSTVILPSPVAATYYTYPDTFQNINCGIYSNLSDVQVFGNRFANIKSYESGRDASYGVAIFAKGYIRTTNVNLRPSLYVQTDSIAPTISSPIHFRNCATGIYGTWLPVSAMNNYMDSVVQGIYTATCRGLLNINNNYLDHTFYGISLLNNTPNSQRVSTNTIYVSDGFPTTQTGFYGIRQTQPNNSIYVNTEIDSNLIINGRYSIWLNNTCGTGVFYNVLHQSSTASILGFQAGINAASCRQMQLAYNTVDGNNNEYSGNLFSPYHKIGISLSTSPSGNVFCNTLGGTSSATGVGYGMDYRGICNQQYLSVNTMNQSQYGIYLQPTGALSRLPDQGSNTPFSARGNDNVFNGNGTGVFNNPDSFRTYTVPVTNVDSTYHAPVFWFTSSTDKTDPSGPSQNVAIAADSVLNTYSTSICFYARPFPIQYHGFRFERAIAADSGSYYMSNGYETTGKWLAERMVFQELKEDTALLNSDTILQSFYTSKSTGVFGDISQFEDTLASLSDSVVMRDSVLYNHERLEADILIKSISATNSRETNYIHLNTIYLDLLSSNVDTFTTSQLHLLDSIANLCPYTAGDAVYIARSLYAMANDSIYYDDVDLCPPPGEEMMARWNNASQDTTVLMAPTIEFVKVYPNPAKDELNLIFFAKTEGQVQFEITDQLGEMIKEEKIPEGITFEKYSTGSISNGVYYWRLRDSNRVVKSGKIVIIK